jgi:hypothetical protein
MCWHRESSEFGPDPDPTLPYFLMREIVFIHGMVNYITYKPTKFCLNFLNVHCIYLFYLCRVR